MDNTDRPVTSQLVGLGALLHVARLSSYLAQSYPVHTRLESQPLLFSIVSLDSVSFLFLSVVCKKPFLVYDLCRTLAETFLQEKRRHTPSSRAYPVKSLLVQQTPPWAKTIVSLRTLHLRL